MTSTIYIAGSEIDVEDFVDLTQRLTDEGYSVLNADIDASLRDTLVGVAQADAICLLPYWWTSHEAIAAQQAAAWLRLTVIDPFTLKPVDDFKKARR